MKKSVAASEKPVKAKEFDKELFKRSVEYNVRTLYRKNLEEADAQQIFQAVSYAIKDRIVENWMETQKAYEKEDPKMVYYMSMELSLIHICCGGCTARSGHPARSWYEENAAWTRHSDRYHLTHHCALLRNDPVWRSDSRRLLPTGNYGYGVIQPRIFWCKNRCRQIREPQNR